MNKLIYALIICSIFCCNISAKDFHIPEKKINWGMKVGFNSAIPTSNVETESGELSTKTLNEVGYLCETFMRINVKKMFFQPELSYSLTKENVYIQTPENSDYATIKFNVNAINLSAIVGYNTVKQNQYGLNVFIGCKYKYAYQINVKPSNTEKYTDTDSFYNMYITSGVGVNISHLFFDFRYDFSLMDNKTDVTQEPGDSYGKIVVNHKANILSFSIGVMF